MISERVEEMIKAGVAYPLAESSEEGDFIKLCSNENPFGPSPKAVEAIKNKADEVGEYPESSARELKESIGEYIDVNSPRFASGTDQMRLWILLARLLRIPGIRL